VKVLFDNSALLYAIREEHRIGGAFERKMPSGWPGEEVRRLPTIASMCKDTRIRLLTEELESEALLSRGHLIGYSPYSTCAFGKPHSAETGI
jgi:hypothetical protein